MCTLFIRATFTWAVPSLLSRICCLRCWYFQQILLDFFPSPILHFSPCFPRVRWRRPKCDRIAPSHPLSWPCVSDFLQLKGESWLRAETLDDSTPQWRISELRVWSYEHFIVFAPSSSGYTSGQNLEVLYKLITEISKHIKKLCASYQEIEAITK